MNIPVISTYAHKPVASDQSYQQQYMIYSGILSTPVAESTDNKKLLIGNTFYHTLLNGIDMSTTSDDFSGIIEILYSLDDEVIHLVFAVWFNHEAKRYLLTALGQYSSSSYEHDLRSFRSSNIDKHLCIRLSQISEKCLSDLPTQLQTTGLPNATVLFPYETLRSHDY